jgi:hypothetical protein
VSDPFKNRLFASLRTVLAVRKSYSKRLAATICAGRQVVQRVTNRLKTSQNPGNCALALCFARGTAFSSSSTRVNNPLAVLISAISSW